ncbi:MAG: DUF1552 domain-containing protein [Planctomycetales bacterium]|nr:DUF1552 domain-containing protein [Planctomycetales bacterium]
MPTLHRRTFLRAAGVSLSLPLLDAMIPATGRGSESSEQARRRMVLIDLGFGLHASNLFPTKTGRDYEQTPYLDVIKEFRDDFTIISGTSHPDVDGGHFAAKSFLTAAPKPTSANFKNSISLDQYAAERIGLETRFNSLTLSLMAGRGIAYSRSGVEIPSESRASRLFAKMFLDGKPEEKQQQIQRLKDGQSVMDAVLDRAKAMQSRVGPRDREKLDQYFSAVRATEQRLVKAEEWEHRPKPHVKAKPPQDVTNSADVIGGARLMFDMIHLALETDSTRLITFYNPGVNAVPPIAGVTQDYHNLSHHGQDAERLAQLKVVEMEQMKAFAEFLGKLSGTKEAGGTLLGNTMVLLGSDLGNASSHDNHNLPIILAGGDFKHGQHLAFDKANNYPLPNLFVSMLQRLGLEADKFASSTGTMTGLEV